MLRKLSCLVLINVRKLIQKQSFKQIGVFERKNSVTRLLKEITNTLTHK